MSERRKDAFLKSFSDTREIEKRVGTVEALAAGRKGGKTLFENVMSVHRQTRSPYNRFAPDLN